MTCTSADPGCYKCDLDLDSSYPFSCHQNQQSGTCMGHGICAASGPSPEFASAIEAGDIDRLIVLLKLHPNSYVLNRERGALQLIGCGDEVIAQYPVTESITEAVEKA
jgi:hypothetical protein